MKRKKSIFKQIVWNNSDIKCSYNILYYKQCQEKDIKYKKTYIQLQFNAIL